MIQHVLGPISMDVGCDFQRKKIKLLRTDNLKVYHMYAFNVL